MSRDTRNGVVANRTSTDLRQENSLLQQRMEALEAQLKETQRALAVAGDTARDSVHVAQPGHASPKHAPSQRRRQAANATYDQQQQRLDQATDDDVGELSPQRHARQDHSSRGKSSRRQGDASEAAAPSLQPGDQQTLAAHHASPLRRSQSLPRGMGGTPDARRQLSQRRPHSPPASLADAAHRRETNESGSVVSYFGLQWDALNQQHHQPPSAAGPLTLNMSARRHPPGVPPVLPTGGTMPEMAGPLTNNLSHRTSFSSHGHGGESHQQLDMTAMPDMLPFSALATPSSANPSAQHVPPSPSHPQYVHLASSAGVQIQPPGAAGAAGPAMPPPVKKGSKFSRMLRRLFGIKSKNDKLAAAAAAGGLPHQAHNGGKARPVFSTAFSYASPLAAGSVTSSVLAMAAASRPPLSASSAATAQTFRPVGSSLFPPPLSTARSGAVRPSQYDVTHSSAHPAAASRPPLPAGAVQRSSSGHQRVPPVSSAAAAAVAAEMMAAASGGAWPPRVAAMRAVKAASSDPGTSRRVSLAAISSASSNASQRQSPQRLLEPPLTNDRAWGTDAGAVESAAAESAGGTPGGAENVEGSNEGEEQADGGVRRRSTSDGGTARILVPSGVPTMGFLPPEDVLRSTHLVPPAPHNSYAGRWWTTGGGGGGGSGVPPAAGRPTDLTLLSIIGRLRTPSILTGSNGAIATAAAANTAAAAAATASGTAMSAVDDGTGVSQAGGDTAAAMGEEGDDIEVTWVARRAGSRRPMPRGVKQAAAEQQQPVLAQVQPNMYCCEPELVGPLPAEPPESTQLAGGASANSGYVTDELDSEDADDVAKNRDDDNSLAAEQLPHRPAAPSPAVPTANPFLADSTVAAFLAEQPARSSRDGGGRSASSSQAGQLVLSYGSNTSRGGSAAGVGRYDGGGGRYDSDDTDEPNGVDAQGVEGLEDVGRQEDGAVPAARRHVVQPHAVDDDADESSDRLTAPIVSHETAAHGQVGSGVRDSSSVLFASAVDPSWRQGGQPAGCMPDADTPPTAHQVNDSNSPSLPTEQTSGAPAVNASLSARRTSPGLPVADGGHECADSEVAQPSELGASLQAGALSGAMGSVAHSLQGSSGHRSRRGARGSRHYSSGVISLADVEGSVLLSTGIRTSVRASAASGGARRWGVSSLALANAGRYDEEGDPDEGDEGTQSSPTYSSASDIDEEMEGEAMDTNGTSAAEVCDGPNRQVAESTRAADAVASSTLAFDVDGGADAQITAGVELADTASLTAGAAAAAAIMTQLADSTSTAPPPAPLGAAPCGAQPPEAVVAAAAARESRQAPGSPAVCGVGSVRLNAFGFRQPTRQSRPQPLSAERRAPLPPVFMAVARPRSFSLTGSTFVGAADNAADGETALADAADAATAAPSSLSRRRHAFSESGGAEEVSGSDSLENVAMFTQIVDGISIKYRPPPVQTSAGGGEGTNARAARAMSSGDAPAAASLTAMAGNSSGNAFHRSVSSPAVPDRANADPVTSALSASCFGGPALATAEGQTLLIVLPLLAAHGDDEGLVLPADGGDSPSGLEDEQPLWHTNPLTVPADMDDRVAASPRGASGDDGPGGLGDDSGEDDGDDDDEGWVSDTCSETCIDGYERHRQVRNSVGDFRSVRHSRLGSMMGAAALRGSEGGGGGTVVVEEGGLGDCDEEGGLGECEGGVDGEMAEVGEEERRSDVCDLTASAEGSPGLPMPPHAS